eukprot:TRINITY_DN165_c0_g1_i1.p1 TRINITY_DN165_c0_g1~~TRINITY_DN165_c0_g1_i1.p1  ORF type:complete len:362 (-),score=91.20 TRINITY_DN165_c0_g1_i1:188-1273(-)
MAAVVKTSWPSIPAGGNDATPLGSSSLLFSVRHENMPGTISGTASTAPKMPVSLPTSNGARETLDVGYPVMNLQKLEDPKVSIHHCAQKYGAQAIRSIFEKLEERSAKPSFEELNFSDNNIGDEGAKSLQEGLSGNAALKTLLLPRTNMRSAGFQSIGGLIGSAPSLEMLVLSGNLADAAGVEGAFSAGLSKNRSLKSLCLAACRLGNDGVQALCTGPLAAHPTLTHVSLNYNRLDDKVCESVSKMLAANKTLEYLELCGNSIGAEGAEEIIKGLVANKGKLKRLGLGQNNLRLQGTKAMCKHFTSSAGSSLEFLDLRHNITTYHGHVELRKMLNKPIDDDETNKGWMINFGERQLMLNAL